MDKTTMIAGGFVVVGILGLFLWGRANQASAVPQSGGAASQLAAAETFYDFGTISMKNGLVEKIFEITNSTDKDVVLDSLTTSCMCTNAYIVKGVERRGPFGMPGHATVPRAREKIPAGGTLEIAAVFDPNAHGPAGVGQIDRFIYLVDDRGGTLTLEIKANVTP